MKILVVGASGTLGGAIVAELAPRHTIIAASRSSGERVDLTDIDSIRALYGRIGKVDAVVSAIGKVHFAPLIDMTAELYDIGIKDKLMGQVNLVQEGLKHVHDSGSFSLTSGILGYDPIRTGASAAMVNAAIDGYVRAAAIDMPRGLRINSISANVFIEAMDVYGPYFRGFKPIPVADAALAFVKSVEGAQTGQTYRV
jgi:NAD(P)-dependent dehydrogenase (short-subunit alcohol dehydrogenase family)